MPKHHTSNRPTAGRAPAGDRRCEHDVDRDRLPRHDDECGEKHRKDWAVRTGDPVRPTFRHMMHTRESYMRSHDEWPDESDVATERQWAGKDRGADASGRDRAADDDRQTDRRDNERQGRRQMAVDTSLAHTVDTVGSGQVRRRVDSDL